MSRIVVEYCPRCGWLARAAWIAQELLATFSEELDEVAIRPAAQGVLRIRIEGEVLWDRKQQGGVPDIVTLKRHVRDRIAPNRPLGHADRHKGVTDD